MTYSLFQDLYCYEPYSIETIRQKPVQVDEFKRYTKMSDEKISQYLSLVKELYKECLLYNSYNEITILGAEYGDNNIAKYFVKYLEFCYANKLITEDDYDRYNSKSIFDFCVTNELSVGLFECYELKNKIIIDSIDDFRMKVEQLFVSYSFSWYLSLRYSCYASMSEDGNTAKLRHMVNNNFEELNYEDVCSLVKEIDEDIADCEKREQYLIKNVPDSNYGLTLRSTDEVEWYKSRISVIEELEKLQECREDIVCYCLDGNDPAMQVTERCKPPILLIYKGRIKCHTDNHNIEQATAILYDINDREIKINVEHCIECDKYYIKYDLFNHYREKYNFIIGNFYMEATERGYDSYTNFALESPLKLSGYNVGQADGLSNKQRRYILARIMHDSIMSKGEVIKYISHFIRMNGARTNNEIALMKWKDDLDFVQGYDINIQPSTIIKEIKKYK